MKTKLSLFQAQLVCAAALGIGSSFSLAAAAAESADGVPTKTSQAIPWSQIGAKAGADYKGEALAIVPTTEGARLRCDFQRLKGEATREGLWLTSTVTNAMNDRFRIVAADVRRLTSTRNLKPETRNEVQSLLTSAATDQGALPRTGNVSIDGQTVRFTRSGLVEEYTVSMDGVRQDFVLLERPAGAGELAVRLAVSGAKVEPAVGGAQLVLRNSGRKIAYGRLRVTDATGKELTARMAVLGGTGHWPVLSGDSPDGMSAATESESAAPLLSDVSPVPLGGSPSGTGGSPVLPSREGRAQGLAVVVNDTDAVYPVRIDPTFSDANWMSMGGLPGANDTVRTAAVDSSGNLYIGGDFTIVGDVFANRIAKWNGSSWEALGSGMGGSYPNVSALAVLNSDVYAGGYFTSADGSAANYVAKLNGSSWTALGSGMSDSVAALVVSGSNLYAGGSFTTTGGGPANYIAKWNGNSWSALGSGMNSDVRALAVSGSDLYAGGLFTTAGGSAANYIAKWDGTAWTNLGSGTSSYVEALVVSGSNVFAGGIFTAAGGGAANRIAKWNGSTWTNLGSGMNNGVYALALSGSDLYAGGTFTSAGGNATNRIAKWNGSNWTNLSSGMNSTVYALAVSGSNLYAGGLFTKAGNSNANNIAKWNGSNWSALGSGMGGLNSDVRALAVSGSDVYAGGNFTTAGGGLAYRIAKWNGSSWTNLGSGMNNRVFELALSGSDLYVGGTFNTAGDKVSGYVARAYLPTLPTLSVFRSSSEVMVSWASAETIGFALEQAGTLAAPASWVTNTVSVTDDGTNKSVTLPATNSAQFFRLRRP